MTSLLARHGGGFEIGQNFVQRGVQCAGKMPHLVGRGNNWWHNQDAVAEWADDEAVLAGGPRDLKPSTQVGRPVAVAVARDEVDGTGQAELAGLGDIRMGCEMGF